MKKNVLIIEGPDRVGKDFLRVKLDKIYDYSWINVVRGPIGYEAYNRMFNKGQDTEAFKLTAQKMDEYAVTLMVRCKEETLARRMIDSGEILRGCSTVEESLKVMMERMEKYLEVFVEAKESWGPPPRACLPGNFLLIPTPLNNLYVIDNDGTPDEFVAKAKEILDKYAG